MTFIPTLSAETFALIFAHPIIPVSATILLPLGFLFIMVLILSPSARNRSTHIGVLGLTTAGVVSLSLSSPFFSSPIESLNRTALEIALLDLIIKVSLFFLILVTVWVVSHKLVLNKLKYIEELRVLCSWAVAVAGLSLITLIYLTGQTGTQDTSEKFTIGAAEISANSGGGSGDTASKNGGSIKDLPVVSPSYIVDNLVLDRRMLTREFVATHFNRKKYCWIIIDYRVYNFTFYISSNSKKAIRLAEYCGLDTENSVPLKQKAAQLSPKVLDKYFVADLGATLDLTNYNLPRSLKP